jgi:hypothetical protein
MWTIIFLGSLGGSSGNGGDRARTGFAFILLMLALWLMIGLRDVVGGDWGNYVRIYNFIRLAPLSQALGYGDFGYTLVNLAAAEVGGGIWLVNLLCATLFVFGLAKLAGRQPLPWLAVLVAFPYLIVVVAMGYTRQGAAIGCIMIGLAGFLQNTSLLRYIFWIAVAALFHKTAVVALPLLVFVTDRGRLVNFALLLSATAALFFALLDDSTDTLVRNYIDARYASSGALIRLFMCVVPGLVFLIFRKQLRSDPLEERLWRNFSWLSLLAALALAVSPSSTAVDRVALYLLPMQFVILARIPGTLVEARAGKLLIALYSGAVLFTWLNYAVNAEGWLPYDNILLQTS